MTIRIDRIDRQKAGSSYRWLLRIKGLQGQGIYCWIFTGLEGHGLYYSEDERVLFGGPAVDELKTELLPRERFHAHEECIAEDVVQRVAAILVSIGWGPEYFDDRDSISGRREVRKQLAAARLARDLEVERRAQEADRAL